MRKIHFTQIDLDTLDSCFLDKQGNFLLSREGGIGVHEELSKEVLMDYFNLDEDAYWDFYEEKRDEWTYMYEYVESLGFVKYSHWCGDYGTFCVENPLTYAQKLAIKAFCKVNNCSWDRVVN